MYPCEMSDEALLRECRVETYRGSGPGGQKKNKTSSAVRITHVPTGVVATGTESRSQHENKARALARLRLALAAALRRPWAGVPEWWREATDVNGRVILGAKSERYPMIMATLLDALEHCGASVAEAAEAVGASTSGLVADLAGDPVVWAKVQSMRQAHGLHPLSNPRR